MIGRSLFIKLSFSYLMVIALSIASIGVASYFLVEDYSYKSKERELSVKGGQLALMITREINIGGNIAHALGALSSADAALGTNAVVVNTVGQVVATTDVNYKLGDVVEKRYLDYIGQGGVIRDSKQGTSATLTVITPVMRGQKYHGAVIMYSTIYGIEKTVQQLQGLIWTGGLIALGLASVIAVLASNAISQPVRSMSQIALDLAKGDFRQRARVKSKDEIGQLAQAFNYMIGELENQSNNQKELEALRREFVANVSHELRSPLTSVKGYLEAVLDGKGKCWDERQKYLKIAHRETLRMERLISDLLELSRLQAGKFESRMEPVALVPLVEEVTTRYEHRVAGENLRIIMKFSGNPFVLGDKQRLEQVLENFLNNAIRFTSPGGIIIVRVEEYNDQAAIHVEDTGIGIEPEDLPKVWDRFYKVDKARTPSLGGTGLGLAIAKELIELQGGSVTASSVRGKGAIFTFTLPIHVQNQEREFTSI
ncbi:MAG: sensor histidine kinase [Thermincolia bacterium]